MVENEIKNDLSYIKMVKVELSGLLNDVTRETYFIKNISCSVRDSCDGFMVALNARSLNGKSDFSRSYLCTYS